MSRVMVPRFLHEWNTHVQVGKAHPEGEDTGVTSVDRWNRSDRWATQQTIIVRSCPVMASSTNPLPNLDKLSVDTEADRKGSAEAIQVRHACTSSSPLLTPVSDLLIRPASPLPEDVVDGIYFTTEELDALKSVANDALEGRVLTRTSTMSSMIHDHKDNREVQRLIHDQMDRIYSDPAMKQYYHAFSVAMVALLDGSMLFQEVEGRVSVSIEADTKYEVITGVTGAIGGAVPGLDRLVTVIEKVCAAYNKKEFGQTNSKLSGLMEPDEIRSFVPSMARPLTLFMAGRLAQSQSGGKLKESLATLQHLHRRLSGSAGATKAETAIIVMGFHHASKIAFAMADGEHQTPPLLGLATANLQERIALTLKWYCDHSNVKGNPPMKYDPREVVVGFAHDYVFKSGERSHVDALKLVEIEKEVGKLRNEVSDLKRTNVQLLQRIEALESNGTTNGPSNASMGQQVEEAHRLLRSMKEEFDRYRLRHVEHTLTKAAEILTSFLSAQPDESLSPKVERDGDGQLRRKVGLVGSSTVVEHLSQKYGSARRDERFYTIEHDLVHCARKWIDRWNGDLEEALLDASRGRG